MNTAISIFNVYANSGFQHHDTEPVMMVKFSVKSETLNFAAHDFSDTDTDFVHFSVVDAENSARLLFVVNTVDSLLTYRFLDSPSWHAGTSVHN